MAVGRGPGGFADQDHELVVGCVVDRVVVCARNEAGVSDVACVRSLKEHVTGVDHPYDAFLDRTVKIV